MLNHSRRPSLRNQSTSQSYEQSQGFQTIRVESDDSSDESSSQHRTKPKRRGGSITPQKQSRKNSGISSSAWPAQSLSMFPTQFPAFGASIGPSAPQITVSRQRSLMMNKSAMAGHQDRTMHPARSITFLGVSAESTIEAPLAASLAGPAVLEIKGDPNNESQSFSNSNFHVRRLAKSTNPFIASDHDGRLISSMNVGMYNVKEDEVPFHKQLQTDDMLRFLYRIFPNDARQVFVSQKTATRLDSFVRFIYLYKLKRGNVNHLRCLEDVDAVADAIKLCLKVTSRSTQHLVLLSNRLMKAVKTCQQFIRKSLSNLREQKDALLHRWVVSETRARAELTAEIDDRKKALQCLCANSSQSKDIGKAMEELHLDCWTSTSKKIAAIDSCWLERRDAYCAKFREWRTNRMSQLVREMGLDGFRSVSLPDSPTEQSPTATPTPSLKVGVGGAARPVVTTGSSSVWSRSALLRRGLLGYPQLHFRADDISLKELSAHLQLCTLRAVVSHLPLGSPEAITYVRSQPMFVGPIALLPTPSSYYHALLTLPCRKDGMLLLLLLRQRALGEERCLLPPVGPTTLKRLRATADEMSARWHSGLVEAVASNSKGPHQDLQAAADRDAASHREESYGARRHALATREQFTKTGTSASPPSRLPKRPSSAMARGPIEESHSSTTTDARRPSLFTHRPPSPSTALTTSARPQSAGATRTHLSARARLQCDQRSLLAGGYNPQEAGTIQLPSPSLAVRKGLQSERASLSASPPTDRRKNASLPFPRSTEAAQASFSTINYSPIRSEGGESSRFALGSPSPRRHAAPTKVGYSGFDETKYFR